MTPIAEMVRKLFEKGVDQEAILIAIEAAEQLMMSRSSADVRVTDRDEQAERRRERDRVRQQQYRDNLRIQRDNPQTSADVTNASLSKEVIIEEGKEVRGSPKRDVTRGHRLPDDWQPSTVDRASADLLLGETRVPLELEKFRDHWKQQPGSRGVKLDWDAAWRNWIRRAAEYQSHGAKNGRRTVHDAARDFHEGILRQINAFDEPAPRSLRIGESEDVVRLLPAGRRE